MDINAALITPDVGGAINGANAALITYMSVRWAHICMSVVNNAAEARVLKPQVSSHACLRYKWSVLRVFVIP